MVDYKSSINKYINLETEIIKNLDVNAINEVMNVLEETRLNGGTIYIYITLTDGGRIVEWLRYEGKEYEMKCTLYTKSAPSDSELQEVIVAALKN